MLKWIWLRLSLLLLISALIGACVFSYPERHTRDSSMDVLRPYAGQIVPISEITVQTRAFHYGLEVASIKFYANGLSIGEAEGAPASETDYYAVREIQWTPPEVGEYLIQARADIVDGADVMSPPVRICVIGFEIDPGTEGVVYGFDGPCDVPGGPRLPRAGSMSMAARAEPDPVIYNEHIETVLCPDVANPSLRFTAIVQDPPDEISYVVAYYSLTYRASSVSAGETRTTAVLLSNSDLREPSTEIYSGQSEPLQLMLGNVFGGDGGSIVWWAHALGPDGRILLVDGPHTVEARPACDRIVPLILPLPATATLEPSEENCPPGTYYAPVTNQCIAIEIQSPRPGNRCSDYSTLNSCTAAGCTWDGQSQSCK